MSLLTIVILLALVATAVILVMGIGSMMRGGEYDDQHETQFLFARVGLQGLTFVLLMVALYLANN